jgi:DNA polymerase III delta prime subunit
MSAIHPDHNTYLATGGAGEAVRAIYAALESVLEIPTKGNPDFWHGSYGQFGIDESRELKAMAAMRAFGERRAMIVETLVISTDAQQAILKLAEELGRSAYFFLIVPSAEHILPTLRSRLIHLKHDQGQRTVSEEAKTFLASVWKVREEVLVEIHKERDFGRAYKLLDDVEQILNEKKDYQALSATIDAKKRLLDGVVPMKTTLETVSLLLPRIL